jgi:hypothetical protein
VADFCPICRDFQPFRLIRVGLAHHINFIAITKGKLVGYERACQACTIKMQANKERYLSVATDKHLELDGLVEATFPAMRKTYEQRMELEKRARQRKLTRQERTGLVREPFELVDHMMNRRPEDTQLGWHDALTFGGLLLGFVAAWITGLALVAGGWDQTFIMIVLAIPFLLFAAWIILSHGRRFTRGRVYPLLFRALGPLDPSEQEIEETLLSLKEAGLAVGKKIKPRDFFQALGDHVLRDGL